MHKLYKTMSVEAFEQGYFYATELKAFAKELGIDVGVLRKNEVEAHIKARLSGEKHAPLPQSVANRKTKGARDTLSPDVLVVNYVSDKATKTFLKTEVLKKAPTLKDKSGQWYWLNDWRKEQIRNNKALTYKDLITHLYTLMTTKGRLPKIPSTLFNNFITDFLADRTNAGATRKDAMDEWEKLKAMPIQKNYQAYKQYITASSGAR